MTVEFKHATLPNGLTVIGEIDPDAHTSAVGFFVKTGARDEIPGQMGVSHYLEHMMFKGSDTRSASDVDRQFDEIGAQHNAFTTAEMTAFWAHCLPECLDQAEDILADILRPALRQQDFDDEKSVILEEIAMYQDHPFWELYEKTMEAYYHPHRLGHRVLGTEDTVSNLTQPQMLEYFTERYAADNTVAAYAGAMNFDQVVERLGQRCASWNTSKTQRVYDDWKVKAESFTIESSKINRHYLLMLSPAPALMDDQRYPAAMLAHILGDVEGSRLYWSLVETGLAEEAQAGYEGRDGTGEYMIFCSCSPEDANRVETIALEQVAGLIDSLTEDDLLRVRSKVATSATLAGELPAGRMRRLGQLWTYHGKYHSLEDELARINTVTLADLKAVHEAYPLQPVVFGRLTPA